MGSGATVVMFLGVLLALWLIPMTIKQHRQTLVVAQVLNSVAGLDVFVMTVLVSVLQLEGYANFILEELHLEGINEQLNNIVPAVPYIANQIPGDDYRIKVTSSLLPGGFTLLAAACVVSTVLGLVVLNKSSRALFDTDHRPIEASFADAGIQEHSLADSTGLGAGLLHLNFCLSALPSSCLMGDLAFCSFHSGAGAHWHCHDHPATGSLFCEWDHVQPWL